MEKFKFMKNDLEILKRLYKDYTKKYLKKILLSVFFQFLLAGSTSSIAYLLDPAIKKLFIEQNQTLILFNTWFNCFCFCNKRWIFIY